MSSNSNRRPKTTSAFQALLTTMPTPAIPGYRIERLIGEGGFGQVWYALRDDGTRVAIKILHLELVRSKDALVRFERELTAIESLDHPNVVDALDHGTLADSRPYLVLEYVEGPSLRDTIHDRGCLSPSETLAILAPLADALAHAHAQGLIHRDVKASNVILGDNGTRPVLLDFGLVKLLTDEGPGLTSSRSMLGTPAAMAPEQMRGLAVDARTDVYALGLLAFHMLTGAPAFGASPGVVQSYLQIHGPRPRPSAKVDLDPAIDGPIVRALAPDPGLRFATPLELVAALREVIQPAPTIETDVIALYVEGSADDVARATRIGTSAGMIVALEMPDSVIAVARELDVATMCARLDEVVRAGSARIAVGKTRATITGSVVDGPALDAESWAPFPLAVGLWVATGLDRTVAPKH